MIVTKVFGGLGNQMFQYAAGRALALRLQAALQVDVRTHAQEGASHNGYELSRVFVVDAPEATDATVRRLLGWRSHRQVQRVLRKARVAMGAYVAEPQFQHWPGFHALSDDVYLDGYWQSPRYFADVESQIRADFRFRQPLVGANAEVAQAMASHPNAVSLHVRRGDYVSNQQAAAHHGTCGPAYYAAALERIRSATQAPLQCFVFSDNIDWARGQLPLPENTVFIGHNRGVDSHFDMQLMSGCRHSILANSSFSWWGAWLNPDPDRLVIGPSRWFLANLDTSTLTPPAWIRL